MRRRIRVAMVNSSRRGALTLPLPLLLLTTAGLGIILLTDLLCSSA